MKILAMDLGKFKSVSCLFDTETNQSEFQTFSTNRSEIENVIKSNKPNQVVFETCTSSGWIYDLCTQMGFKAIVANPSQEAWQWKNVKRKTDKDDALKLARLAALEQITPVYVPNKESREYRRLVKFRKVLVWRINKIQCRIRSLFSAQGMHLPTKGKAWTVAGIQALEKYCKPLVNCSLSELWKGELEIELNALDHLWEQLAQVEKQLNHLAKQNERVQLLMTIPGVGRKTAEVIVSVLDDPHRFQNSRQVSSYAGLIPEQRQSGQMNRVGKITRRGSRLLRTALVEVSWIMLPLNPWAAETFQRIGSGQKTRRKTAIVAVARKLLVRCWAMLRDNQAWNAHAGQQAAAISS